MRSMNASVLPHRTLERCLCSTICCFTYSFPNLHIITSTLSFFENTMGNIGHVSVHHRSKVLLIKTDNFRFNSSDATGLLTHTHVYGDFVRLRRHGQSSGHMQAPGCLLHYSYLNPSTQVDGEHDLYLCFSSNGAKGILPVHCCYDYCLQHYC